METTDLVRGIILIWIPTIGPNLRDQVTIRRQDKKVFWSFKGKEREHDASRYTNELYPAFSTYQENKSFRITDVKFDSMQC